MRDPLSENRRARIMHGSNVTSFSRLALGTALASLFSGCTSAPRDAGFAAEDLCALHVAARRSGEYSEFLSAAERELGVKRSSFRLVVDGVFVRTSGFFVEEQGFFFASPGAVLSRDADPSFEPLRSCIYRYKIVG